MRDREGPRSKRSSDKPTRPEGAASRTRAQGRSGYGVDSLRPHLQDQFALEDLLRPRFPPGPRHKPEPREEG